jgi:glyoxylase-like metal-dependent hydrolase (beta-lactamase superfamily II)
MSGKMLTGDHVLDPVTPHVGIWLEERGNALAEYEASLARVAAAGASGALPAHGEPFTDLAGRVDELLAHHRHREAQILTALISGPRNAADVARALPWRRRGDPFETLPAMHQQFAVAETLAHLVLLRSQDLLVSDAKQTPIIYALSERASTIVDA